MYNNKFDKPNFLLRLRSFVVKLLSEYWAFRNFRLKGVGRELAQGLHSPPFPVSAPLHKNTAKQLLYIVRNKKVGFPIYITEILIIFYIAVLVTRLRSLHDVA